MPKKPVQRESTLDDLRSRLDTLIVLLMKPADQYSDSVAGLQIDILRLCDYEHTTEDICRKVGKTAGHVQKELSLLRAKGFVKTVSRDDRQVHIRLRA